MMVTNIHNVSLMYNTFSIHVNNGLTTTCVIRINDRVEVITSNNKLLLINFIIN